MTFNAALTDDQQPVMLGSDHGQRGTKRRSSGQTEESGRRPRVFRVFPNIEDKSTNPFDNVTTLLGDQSIKVPADLKEKHLAVLKRWMRENAKAMDCPIVIFDVDVKACTKLKEECVQVVEWLQTALQRGESSRQFREVESRVYEFRKKVYGVYNNREWEWEI
jgi:hypothetical protein